MFNFIYLYNLKTVVAKSNNNCLKVLHLKHLKAQLHKSYTCRLCFERDDLNADNGGRTGLK